MTKRDERLANGGHGEIVAAHEKMLPQFLKHERRDRFRQLLRSDRGRAKLRRRLAHFRDLEPTVCRSIPSSMRKAASIEAILTQHGAPQTCYAISEDDEIDGVLLPLREVLEAIVGHGSGTLVSCIPGRLGYFEEEGPGVRYILVAPGN